MNIGSWKKTSFIEVPGHISTIFFVNKCNFSCGFCHVPFLLENENTISNEEIFQFLEKRKNQVEFVAISGGEPTLQKDLFEFLRKAKRFKYKTAIETNGSKPEIIKQLLEENLLDYIMMDIKTDKENYSNFCNPNLIQQSIDFIKNSNINYEFRTTMVPKYTQNFEKIVSWISGAKNYYLQQFVPDNCKDEEFRQMKPYHSKQIKEFQEIAKQYIPNCKIRS
jgi:pyruvate formate lyase activating enzyme